MTIKALQPTAVWHYFHALSQIPRPSYDEAAIQQFVLAEAARLGLSAERDDAGNILVRKPATAGRENEAGVILQGHLDMVAQKNSDKTHDFHRDPITTLVEGEWVRADGTTLGADNGVGVAMILAILAADDVSHPPLEALFTASEETGMEGAKGLAGGVLQGKYLLNLDYEDEGKLCIGCAGGVDGSFHFPYQTEAGDFSAYQLSVRGLRGGHSGVDIAKQRGNAIVILAQVLHLAGVTALADFRGGDLRNAIPREATAIIHLQAQKAAELQEKLPAWQAQISRDIAADDPNLCLELTPCANVKAITPPAEGQRLIDVVRAWPNAVVRMSLTMADLVETSSNLAAVRMDEGVLQLHCLLRSSNDFQRDNLAAQMASVARLAGGTAEFSGAYGGWLPAPESSLVQLVQRAGAKVYDHVPPLTAIHAGLECGILAGHYPAWQMVAFGPTIESPHSPDERVNIASVARSYQWLVAALQEPFAA